MREVRERELMMLSSLPKRLLITTSRSHLDSQSRAPLPQSRHRAWELAIVQCCARSQARKAASVLTGATVPHSLDKVAPTRPLALPRPHAPVIIRAAADAYTHCIPWRNPHASGRGVVARCPPPVVLARSVPNSPTPAAACSGVMMAPAPAKTHRAQLVPCGMWFVVRSLWHK